MKKSIIIAVVLCLTLAFTGAAYALWAQDMNINGTVNTASFDVRFDSASSDDEGTTIDPGKPEHVAITTASLDDIYTGKVLVNNAYPGYFSTSTFVIKNLSSIPVKITDVTVTNNSGGVLALDDSGSVAEGTKIDSLGTANVIIKNTVIDDPSVTVAPNTAYGYTIAVTAEQAQ